MKFNCGPTKAEKRAIKEAKLKEWHKKFLWWPRRMGPRDCRWLEYVEYREGWFDEGAYYPGHSYKKQYRLPTLEINKAADRSGTVR